MAPAATAVNARPARAVQAQAQVNPVLNCLPNNLQPCKHWLGSVQ